MQLAVNVKGIQQVLSICKHSPHTMEHVFIACHNHHLYQCVLCNDQGILLFLFYNFFLTSSFYHPYSAAKCYVRDLLSFLTAFEFYMCICVIAYAFMFMALCCLVQINKQINKNK